MSAFRCACVVLPLCLGVFGAPNPRANQGMTEGKTSKSEADSAKEKTNIEAAMTSDEVIDQKMAEVMGLASEFKKAPVVKKMARFLLDFGGSNDLNSGYTTSDGTANLFNLDIDSAAVMEVSNCNSS